jgi:hypothetical protein
MFDMFLYCLLLVLVMGRVYILCIRRQYAASLLHGVVIGEVYSSFGMCVFSAYS